MVHIILKPKSFKLVFLLISILLVSCSTVTKVDNLNTGLKAKDSDCNIQFFDETKVNKKHIPLSKIEAHIQKNLFFGGRVSLNDEAFDELRKKACELGGDAVIIDDFIETSALEFSHIHVWATVIKFVKTIDPLIPSK